MAGGPRKQYSHPRRGDFTDPVSGESQWVPRTVETGGVN